MSDLNVQIIKANPFFKKGVAPDDNTISIAAYARVSTDSDQQEDSFERQLEYYTNLVESNPNWKLVKVYSDLGISGTRADKRPGFQEMLKDCREGKINRIFTKSLSRFARNTVDCLKYIRELKELGISVFFESQNIDTLSTGGEILITVLAATAEEESRTISKNIKWSYQRKFQNGDFVVNYSRFLGYTRDENHKMIIVPEEAEIVKRIYRSFLYGHSITQIAKDLTKDGIKTAAGKPKWLWGSVYGILTNEKYYGAALMGKTYKPDVLSKRRYKNEGQVESYYVENAFDGIVTKEEFMLVQKELKRRSDESSKNGSYSKYSSKFPFSKMIKCGACGSYYVRGNNIRDGATKIPCWWCSNARDGDGCQQRGISERTLENGFVFVFNQLLENGQDIKGILQNSISSVIQPDPRDKIIKIDNKISELQDKMIGLHKQKTNGEITPILYSNLGNKIATEIDDLKKEKEDIETQYENTSDMNKRINDMMQVIDTLNPLTSFDQDVFKKLVDSIVINQRNRVTFKFKVGFERTIEIPIK